MPNSNCECGTILIACLHCHRASQMCLSLRAYCRGSHRSWSRSGPWSLPVLLPGSLAVQQADNGAAQCPEAHNIFGTGQLITNHWDCSALSAFCLSHTETPLICERKVPWFVCVVNVLLLVWWGETSQMYNSGTQFISFMEIPSFLQFCLRTLTCTFVQQCILI